MRFFAIFPILTAAGLLLAEETGYVNLRTDLIRVSGDDVKKSETETLKYDESARVMTVYMNVLNETRAETRLRASSGSSETGISFQTSSSIRKTNLIHTDISVYYRVPQGGIFRSSDGPGFNDAVGFSVKRMMRATVPAAAGLYRLPEGKAIVPLITAYAQYPLSGIISQASEAELRLISADSPELRRTADFPLEEPLLRDYVLDRIAVFSDAFRISVKIRSKKTVFTQTKDAVKIKFQLIEFAKGIYRLTFSETVSIRKDNTVVPETFFYEGYLSAQPGKWIMPVRIVSAHAGRRSFYETDSGNIREKLLMIRFR